MFNRALLFGKIGGIIEITIDTDQFNWNLITDGFGGTAPTKSVDVEITNNANLSSTIPSVAALDLTGLPAGSTIKLINNGNIFGAGGNGGVGVGAFGGDLR